jgi:hypothetical protein
MRVLVCLFIAFLAFAQEKVDLFVVNKIKAEALRNSQVMDTAFYLTDVYGPRLTGSPGLKAAGDWTVSRMKEWGLAEPHMEKWGPFGRGWANVRFSAHLKTPQYAPIIGFARPWSPSTSGAVSGEPVLAVLRTEADFAAFKGKLKGKIVLIEEPRTLAPVTGPLSHRYSDAELASMAQAPEGGEPRAPYDREGRRRFRTALNSFLTEEGAALVLVPSSSMSTMRPDASAPIEGGTIFAIQAGSQDPKEPLPPPSAAIATEHYDRIARLLQHKQPVIIEFEVENKFFDDPQDSFSVVAEITGGAKRDEIVMLGGHIDSWSFSTGATDNASGVAVTMEAMRILKVLNLKMDRTVRLGLWTGEEQGLLGSRAYVAEHFGTAQAPKPDQAKVSGYFNYDNGTGRIRGVYLQGNDMMRPVFEAWLAPFRDMGVTTITGRDTSGTDHLSFDGAGIPGFQFIQDPVEYMTRTHHTNMDSYERLQPGDLMQSAAVMAAVVYHAATRPEMLPRKPLSQSGSRRSGGARPPSQ